MALDYTQTTDLLAAYETRKKPTTFLQSRYFPNGVNFNTVSVLVEYKNGTQTLAPFVSPEIGGKIVKRQGYRAVAYEPAFIAPKRAMTVDTLAKKGFGEALYNGLSPADRAMAITLDDLTDMDDMITRRLEQMSAEVLQTNALIMKHETENGEIEETKEIAFYEGTNDATYEVAVSWANPAAKILADVAAMAQILTRKGLPATDVILGANAAEAIYQNEEILKLLDNRNVNIGAINPTEGFPEAVFIGTLNCKGHNINFISYNATYEDATGKMVEYIDKDSAIVTAPGCGVTNYGAVTQIEYGSTDFTTYVGNRIPLVEIQGQVKSVALRCAPLVQPKNLNPYVCAKVIKA